MLDDIIPGFLEGVSYQDQMMAVPFAKSVRIMYVNDDILEEYDAEVPDSLKIFKHLAKKCRLLEMIVLHLV